MRRGCGRTTCSPAHKLIFSDGNMSSFGAKRKARVIKVDYDDDESSGDAPLKAEGGGPKDGMFRMTLVATAFADGKQG